MRFNSNGILAKKICASWIRLGSTSWTFFFFGLNVFDDQSIDVHFFDNKMGFLGWSHPKFHDHKVGRRVGEISNCHEVFNWVFVPPTSSTSSISLSRSMGVCQKMCYQNYVASCNMSFQWCPSNTFIFLKIRCYRCQVYQKPISKQDVNDLGSIKFNIISNQFNFCQCK
jgi:hypothetical protein